MQPWTKPEENPYKGIIYCRVTAPANLKRPMLPCRTQDMLLIFPLCRRCADEHNQIQPCRNEDEKISQLSWRLHSCWTQQGAITCGYVVSEVFEFHHYEKCAHQGGAGDKLPLFAGYINAFIKMKLEASGWPERCKSEEEKQQFIDESRLQDGIELDRAELDKALNPTLRQTMVT